MKKIIDILFVMAFALCLLLPAVTMELGTNVESEIDNAYLPELNTENFTALTTSMTTYVDKRIGFRQEALYLYQRINDLAFSHMEHPTYMYGKEGHVFFKGGPFVQNFQHMNLDEGYADSFSQALANFQDYAEQKGSKFIYFYIPDKETIYPEYYPAGINVYGDVSRSDQILQALDEKGVNYFFAKDVLLEEKKTIPVFNVKYDAGHWNAHGAFASIRHLYTIIQQDYPQLQLIEKDEYDIGQVVMTNLQQSDFKINESVPSYKLKQTTAINKSQELRDSILISFPENYVSHYENPDCKDQPSLLIFGDSYLAGKDELFKNHFSEYTYIHRYNVYNEEFFKYYMDELEPDIVIFENPERSHKIDLYKVQTLN